MRLIDSTDMRSGPFPLTGVAIAMALDAAGARKDCNMRPMVRMVTHDVYEPTGTRFISVDVWYHADETLPECCPMPERAKYAALYTLRCAVDGGLPELFMLDAD